MKQFIIFYSINVFIVAIILLLMEIAQLVLVCAKIVNRVSALNVIQCILLLITFINKIVHYCKTRTLALVVMIILICVYQEIIHNFNQKLIHIYNLNNMNMHINFKKVQVVGHLITFAQIIIKMAIMKEQQVLFVIKQVHMDQNILLILLMILIANHAGYVKILQVAKKKPLSQFLQIVIRRFLMIIV